MKTGTRRTREQRTKHLQKLIQQEVSFFNGWHVSEESERKACTRAAEKIVAYLARTICPQI